MAAYPDGTLLKASGPEIDVISGGVRRWIPDPTTFTAMGLNWNNVVTIADGDWSAIPSGPRTRRGPTALCFRAAGRKST